MSDTIRITRDEVEQWASVGDATREILAEVTRQIRRPNLELASCIEWSQFDDSGIYFVHSINRYARVWIDCEASTATRCELI